MDCSSLIHAVGNDYLLEPKGEKTLRHTRLNDKRHRPEARPDHPKSTYTRRQTVADPNTDSATDT